jgi:hypothetical protein
MSSIDDVQAAEAPWGRHHDPPVAQPDHAVRHSEEPARDTRRPDHDRRFRIDAKRDSGSID